MAEVAVGGAIDERHDAARRRPRCGCAAGSGAHLRASLHWHGAAVLLGPVVLIALYSVNLRTNIPGTPTATRSPTGRTSPPARQPVPRPVLLLDEDHRSWFRSRSRPRPTRWRTSWRSSPEVPLHAPAGASRAVLHQLPAADRRVERSSSEQQRGDKPGLWALHLRPKGNGIQLADLLELLGRPRPVLQLDPVRRPPDLRGSGEHGPPLIEAATDLGASRFTAFWRVTFPLSLPGVIAGFVFVLIPTTGEFITPLVGRRPEQPVVRQRDPVLLHRLAGLELRSGAGRSR